MGHRFDGRFKRPGLVGNRKRARGIGDALMLEDRQVPGLVIEVLYVEHCSNFPAALALVQRVAAELALDAKVRTIMITDQDVAERTRFVVPPRFASTAAMSIPTASWPPRSPWSVVCTA
jgi:hypothetical protein